MKILKAVVFWSTFTPLALIDLVIGLIFIPIVILFWVTHYFTGKAKMMYNLLIEIRFGIAWPISRILVPVFAWYADETVKEAYLELTQLVDEQKASILE